MLLLAFMGSSIVEAKSKEPESDGLQAGGFVMHPGADVAIAYDGRDKIGSDDGFVDVGVHFNTHLADETTKSWTNQLSFKWRQFWGLGEANADGGPEVNVSTNADLFKLSMFRIAPSASYTYFSDPEDDNLRRDFEHHSAKAGVGLYIQPGAGAIFSQRIGYQFSGRFYTEHSDVSHLVHRVDSVTRWNFLPQTSMSLLVDFRAITYLDDDRNVSPSIDEEDTHNSSSYPIRVKYSLQGLMLARMSYVLGLGYAYENYDNGLKEHMFIMNARLRYDFSSNAGIYLEYKKDFDNVIYGDYYKLHRVTLGFDGLWFDHLQTDFKLGYGNFNFRSESDSSRRDNMIIAEAKIFYHFFPGMKLGLEYNLRYNTSDIDSAGYAKNMAILSFAYEY